MEQFSALVNVLGTSTKTNDKLKALVEYFQNANDKDKVWVIALFSGRRPRRTISGALISKWCAELISLPLWVFEESYHTVGDLSETVALLFPDELTIPGVHRPLYYYIERFREMEKANEEEKKEFMIRSWRELGTLTERFVFNKLLSGAFRIGVSQKLMVNALAKTVNLEPNIIAHRISGNWDPSAISFDELLTGSGTESDFSKPYPFYLAYALEDGPLSLGEPADWQAEWKWDGIRGQLIKRNNELFVWSRGEELLTDKFPEYEVLKELLPDGIVLDGEIIPSENGRPLPFAVLQTRIGRKNISKKQLMEAPMSFFLYDILEYNYEDQRGKPMAERRQLLEEVFAGVNHPVLLISPLIGFSDWDELTALRTESRERGAEGLMLKRKSSAYQVGRKRGDWWKWKIDPLVIDAVMIYAQKGSGRRSNLYTDYTFAVQDGEKLVSFTKAYSGLTDKEFNEVDNFVKRNSIEKFGPVRTVKPQLVFEIAFEGIAASNRHKSGVALRFPRISRWRKDKKPEEINTLEDLQALLRQYGK
ncbi:MAG: ATP-dependent DNA ligase [Chitinophagaceae bacterium]|nr:MAG: ATP-dependent DNA ligase [Chitinophagaceae bacterium]